MTVANGKLDSFKKDKKVFPLLFLFCYGLFLAKEVIHTTMFRNRLPFPLSFTIETLCMIATVLLIAKILLNGAYQLRELLGCVLVLAILFVSYQFSGYVFLMELMWLLVASRSVSFDHILKVYIGVTLTIILIAFVASRFGIIENLVYYRSNGHMRQSFGSVFPTDFAAHIFYILLAFAAIRKEKITYWEIGGFAVVGGCLYHWCEPRNSVICIGLLVAACLYVKIRHTIGKIDRILPFAMPFFALLMIVLTWLYSADSSVMVRLNNSLSSRLMLGKAAYVNYGIKPFGQKVDMVGFGGSTSFQLGYNFIDSSYVMALVRYGVAVLLLVLIIFVLAGIKAKKAGNTIVLLAMTILALHCVMEHHLLEIAYNPFLFYLFAEDTSACLGESANVRKRDQKKSARI